MSYAAASDVAQYTPGLLDSGHDNFTARSRPTKKAVERFLSAGCALIEGRIQMAGFDIPVPGAAAIYDTVVDLESMYAAGRAEMVRMSSRVAATERTRYQMFFDQFNKGLDMLMKGDLSRAGVSGMSSDVYIGGISESDIDTVDSDSDRVKPRFDRGQFRNPGTDQPSKSSTEYWD